VTKEERAKARALCDALPFGWWDADFAHGARTLLPAALSDLDRLERGLAVWRCTSCGGRKRRLGVECLYCAGTGISEAASNLLAGREWNDDGTAPKGG
jgi:hypothetical protein